MREGKSKAGKGIKSISGLRKAKKSEVTRAHDLNVDNSVKSPAIPKDDDIMDLGDNN